MRAIAALKSSSVEMRIIAAGTLIVLMVVGLFLARPAPVSDLDAGACDLLTRLAGPGKSSGRVAIVEIDEKSLAQFGRWPWPRDLVGRLTQSTLERGAAVVALDIMFPQEEGARDQAFAQAIAGKPVVVGNTMTFDGGDPDCFGPSLPIVLVGDAQFARQTFFDATGAVCSAPLISQAASVRGFLNAAPDADGIMRRVPMVITEGGRYYPSLALAALTLVRPGVSLRIFTGMGGATRMGAGAFAIPLEGPSLLRLRFRGSRRTFPWISAADVLTGHAPEEWLRGRIAIVGGSAEGMQNPVVTPVDPLFPDLEVQATAIDNLLQGDTFRRPASAGFWELLTALVAGLIATWLLARSSVVWGAAASAGMAVGIWGGCLLVLATAGLLFSPLPATLVLACNLPVLALLNYLREKQRADRTQKELAASTQHSIEILRESESRYQLLVENVNDAIIMDDVTGRLVFANRLFRDWFGLQDKDIRHTTLEDYVAPEWRIELRDRHERRMRGEAVPDHFEFEGIRAGGTRIWIEALITAVQAEGRIAGTQGALRDITERKRMEAQYLQAQKMESVGRLAGGVAHDFNNLLTVINCYSDMLLSRMNPEDRSRQPVEEIHKAGLRAAELTQKLLAFSRKQLIRPRPLNLNVVLADAERMLERVIGEDIQLTTRFSPDLGLAMADSGQIHQVVMNLVVNARDAVSAGGKILVETRNVERDGVGFVYLGVKDNGTGMTEEVKEHLYEPFFTTKEPSKGTGLGLATVYGIVRQSGGVIEVTTALGQGTTFHIYLPRIDSLPAEQPVAHAVPAELRGSETILVVEDEDAVRRLTSAVLGSYGYLVLQASNGVDAMTLAERYPDKIHLLVTDIILPLMDGRVLAQRLKVIRPDAKVLFVSGYSEESIGRNMALEDDLAYLTKPFTARALAERVREVLSEG